MEPDEITRLLKAAQAGDEQAAERFYQAVYQQLRAIARRRMLSERADHTLEPTALVHEAYLRILGTEEIEWQNRAHFFQMASISMYRILLDHARKHNSKKRKFEKVPLLEGLASAPASLDLEDLLSIRDALTKLAAIAPRQAQELELFVFCGLSDEEIASVSRISSRTVRRDIRFAKTWLKTELTGRGNDARGVGQGN